MKGEGGMPGAEGLKGEPGTPVRLALFNYDAHYEIYIFFLYFFKCFTKTQKSIFFLRVSMDFLEKRRIKVLRVKLD